MRTSEECFAEFLKLKAESAQYNMAYQNEADTRARIISRIVHDVLDWPQQNVKREPYANPGYMDYVLFTNKPLAVIEAKRSGDTFDLPPDITKSSRAFLLGGILRVVKNLQEHIDQVAKYCLSNGIEYAIVTNGPQWVIFKALRTDGIHIAQGHVIVFSGLDDIERRFIEFWSILAKPQVDNHSLARAFLPTDAHVYEYRRVTDELHYRNEKVTRNRLSQDLEPVIAEYLGEIAGEGSQEKLKQLYVKSAALEGILKAIEQRISFALPQSVLHAGGRVIETTETSTVRREIERKLKKHINLPPRGEVVLLLGRVGSGKTTFINHFLRIDLQDVLRRHIVVSFDFRLLEPGGNIHNFFYEHLSRALSANKTYRALTPPELRKVYAPEIRELTAGPLAVIEKQNKKRYEEKIADFLLGRYNDTESHISRTIRFLAERSGVKCVFLFDNVDQLDFKLQEEIFTFAHSVSAKLLAFSILPMWEETYVRSSRTGVLSTYQVTAYTLPPTSVVDIINRRLEFIVAEIENGGLAYQLMPNEGHVSEVIDFLSLVRDSIMSDRRRARYFLESIAMGNLRKSMKMFEAFLKSGHTDAGKILSSSHAKSEYLIPLHEFVKSIGLGDTRYYQTEGSYIMNLYSISDEARPSHFTKLRLLHYLFAHRGRTSMFGVGFIRTDVLRHEFLRIGTSETDFTESIKTLAAYSLVENDIYDADTISQAYRITVAGRYYMRYLAAKFGYLDLVLHDTPIADNIVFDKIYHLVGLVELDDRFDRVELFLAYLLTEEEREYAAIVATSESIPLRRRLVPDMLREFREDRAFILANVARRKRFPTEGIRTPYEISPQPNRN
jgi:hypothetical protein